MSKTANSNNSTDTQQGTKENKVSSHVTVSDDVAAVRVLDDMLRKQQPTADVIAEEYDRGASIGGVSIRPEEDFKGSSSYDDKNYVTCNQSQSSTNDTVSGKLECSKCSDEVVINNIDNGDNSNSPSGDNVFIVRDSIASVATYNALFAASQQPEQIRYLKNNNINNVKVLHNEENEQEAANNNTTKTKTTVVAHPQLEDSDNNAAYSHSAIQVVPRKGSSNSVCKRDTCCKPEDKEQKHHHDCIQVIPSDAVIALSAGPVHSEDTGSYTTPCGSPDDVCVYDQLNNVS